MSKQGRVHPMIREHYELEVVGINHKAEKPVAQMNHRSNSNIRPRTKSTENWTLLQKELKTVSKWKFYKTSMRISRSVLERSDGPGPREDFARRSIGRSCSKQTSTLDSDVEGLGAADMALFDTQGYMKPLPHVNRGEQISAAISSSRALIVYFAKLAKAASDSEQELDFEFVEELLEAGADINFTDRHGQSVMHEVARIWHVDIAQFIVENGGDVNKADHFGRTPLHVAAAVDYPEMVEFLVNNNANIHVRTFQEHQTPTHYAAKNDAVKALKVLLKLGGNPEDRDYKQRTSLLVAAELDRSETAKHLIEQSAAAGVQDYEGNCAMTLMISKMPPVAKEALDQFHTTDRANRKQYYYLNYLEPTRPTDSNYSFAKSPLQAVVQFKQMDLIMHPVFQRLIEIKWKQFGRRGTILQIFVQVLYVLICTTLGVTIHFGSDPVADFYWPASKYWWRIVLEVIAVSMTVYFLLQEFLEIRSSKQAHKHWQRWRVKEMEKDLKYCHPRWPEERKYLEMELREICDSGISYFNDAWNYFDWITYGWVSAVVVTRILAVSLSNPTARSLHPKILAITLIFVWLRLMKFFRAFGALGPFIVIIGHIIDDTLKFGFLYFEFFIPYVCAFWIIFGGAENAAKMERMGQDSTGWRNFNDLMYSVWQLTNVGNYPWDSLLVVDRLMAQILCGTYLAMSAIVCLNLFIALMSDTFQRVYDNAKANAAMQRASTILSFEESMSIKRQQKMRQYFNQKLAPEELYYDDDSTTSEGTLEKMTHQIKDVVDDMYEVLTSPAGGEGRPLSGNKLEIQKLREELQEVSERHDKGMLEMRRDIAEMKSLLIQLAQTRSPALPSLHQSPLQMPASNYTASPLPSPLARHASERSSKKSGVTRSHKKKHRKLHHSRSDDDDDDNLYPIPGTYPSLPAPPGVNSGGNNVRYVTSHQRSDAHA